MRRIAQRAVPCQTTRQKQTKWVILKEKCFMSEFIDFQKQDGLKLLHRVVFFGASFKMS
jgi:hypothetical protein